MGVPHRDHQQESEEDTLPGSARRGDVAADSDHDDTAPALGAAANGDQSELGQSARGAHSQSGLSAAAVEEPEPERVPAEEPEPERVPAEEPEPKRRVPEEAAATARPKQLATGEEGSGRFPAEQSSRGSVSVTVLTLDAATELRPRSRQQVLFTPRAGDTLRLGDREAGGDMSDLKLIRDFQVRRKYGRRPGHVPPASSREKNFIDLGLSGTRYFGGGGGGGSSTAGSHHHSSNIGSIGTATLSLDSSRSRKTLALPEDVAGRIQNGPVPVSPALARVQQEEDRAGSVDSVLKDLQSPVPSFPPLSPAGGPGKGGAKSENSFYSSRHNGQSPSLLVNHFGFSTIRPDTFSGIQRQRRLKVTSTDNDGKSAGSKDRMIYERRSQSSVCSRSSVRSRSSLCSQSSVYSRNFVFPELCVFSELCMFPELFVLPKLCMFPKLCEFLELCTFPEFRGFPELGALCIPGASSMYSRSSVCSRSSELCVFPNLRVFQKLCMFPKHYRPVFP